MGATELVDPQGDGQPLGAGVQGLPDHEEADGR